MRRHHRHRYEFTTALAVILAAGVTGCQGPKYADLKVFLQAHDHDVAASDYRIEPPDVITFSCPVAPEIDGTVQTVGSDGKVTLRLLGKVKVSSLTPRETAAKVEELLNRYYVSPKVNVSVLAYESKKIYVFGQVGEQGVRPFTGRDTVLDVLASARLNDYAWGAQVKVIRPSASAEDRHEIVVDVDRMMQTGDLRQNFLLQEGDMVFVPATPLAWVGLKIREVLFPFTQATRAYTLPANWIAATDYYRDRAKGRAYVNFTPTAAP